MVNFLDWQIQYLLLLQEFRNQTGGIFDNFFIGTTWLGEIIVPFTFLAIVYWGINKKAGSFILLTFCIHLYFNVFLKMTACINRPWVLDSKICPIEKVMPMADGYSFPSGHTAGAISVWGSTAFLFWKNKLLRYLMILFVCLVAFSRNYVGVHTPQDVLVSIIIGIIVIFAVYKLQNWLEAKKHRDNLFYLISIILGIMLCIYLQIKCNYDMQTFDSAKDLVCPLDMKHSTYSKIAFYFGALTGWFLERKFVNFQVIKEYNLKKILLLLLGIILLFMTSGSLKELLGLVIEKRFAYSVSAAYFGLFITFLYPCFLKSQNNKL